jgi:hypothetical protein
MVLQGNDEVDLAQGLHRIERVIGRLHAADESTADPTSVDRIVQRDARESDLRKGGLLDSPDLGDFAACAGVLERASAGKQSGEGSGVERPALTCPAGHPGHRGTRLLRESRGGAEGSRGASGALADHDHRAG